MLLVIHNIPMHMKFYDVKNLIQEKCGFKEVILDNFTAEGNNNKRVTVGLADEGDAALLVRKINGLFLSGCQLFVEDMRQKKSSEQPYRPIDNPHVPQPRPDKIAQYNRPDARMPTGMPAQSAPSMTPMPPVQMAYSNLPFYMSPVQASYPTYENQAAQAASKPPLHAAYYPTQHQQPGVENQWNILPAYASQPAKQHSPAPVVNSRDSEWEERDPSRSPSRSPDRDDDWRDSKRHAEPSRSERGRRSPERDRERYGKKASKSSRRIESGGRSRRDIRDRSPPRSREDSRSSRHDEDLMQSKSSSYVERSPPRDRAFERHRRDDRRSFEQRDRRRSGDRRGRDRDRKRSPEKSRDYDNSDDDSDYDKHREDHEHDRRNYGKKNRYSYSDASSSSSKTYGNDPDNSTFSVSNANIFDKRGNARDDSFSGKESGTKRGSFDRKAAPTPKRARKDQDKDAGAAPKVDAAKPIEPPAPDMRKMIIRHNNWRYQVASILAQQIMSAARGPGPIPNKAHIFKELKKCVVARIDVRLGDTIVKSLMEMIESYRSRFPPEDDVTFFNAVMEKIEHDEKESAASAASDTTSEDDNAKKAKAPGDIAANLAEDTNLMPPPTAPGQVRPPNINTEPTVPPFQMRAPTATPTFQNPPPQIQNTAPNVMPQFQNSAQISALQFLNNVFTSQFQNTVPSPSMVVTPNPNPYYQNRAPTPIPQFQNRGPHPNPHYQNVPRNPNPQFANRVPGPRFQQKPTPQYQPGPSSKGKNRILKDVTITSTTASRTQYKWTKKDVAEQKKIHKMELENDDMYPMEPVLKQALDNEIAAIMTLYSARPDYFMKKAENDLFKIIAHETANRFKKVLKMGLTKRVLDIKTALVLRIFPVNKWPNHMEFQAWMKKHGVLSIKQCPKMFVAHCHSYEDYDRLVAMGTFRVGDAIMEIKTMHVGGPPKSLKERKRELYKQQLQVQGPTDMLLFDQDEDAADTSYEDQEGIDSREQEEIEEDMEYEEQEGIKIEKQDDIENEEQEGIENAEQEGIENEGQEGEGNVEENIPNADATENDDVVIVEQEKEMITISDDDVTAPTNTDDDQGTEWTEGDQGAELTEGGQGTELTEGGQGTELTEGGQGTELTEDGQSTELTEGGQGTELTEGGQGTELTEGGQGTELTEGGQGTELTEGGQGTELTEDGQSTELTKSDQRTEWAEGDHGTEWSEDGQGTEWTEGGQGIEWTEGGQGTELTEDDQGTELTEGDQGTELTEGGQDTELTEGGQATELTEGGQGTELTEGDQGAELAETKDGTNVESLEKETQNTAENEQNELDLLEKGEESSEKEVSEDNVDAEANDIEDDDLEDF
ncbi:uncharacterized protein LOC123877979 isoform X2 [Maniola jurtina]|uniref:uncharacterized protein LOC123877979 isoform X2 n=1 Tax=Maniola jurtina TaxID=191418 RepID=UPI001E686295|nr:uncharacterized protein LOC123877979 isoform X2 [Maniola jurtina]